MGAGGRQTVAGALATGTHGAEFDRQPLIDAIRAVHLVGPGGQEWWIERTNAFTVPDRLRGAVPEWCPDTRVVQNDRLFYSAIVGVGRLGVIYALILEVEPQCWLHEQRTKKTYADVRRQLAHSADHGFESRGGLRGRPPLPNAELPLPNPEHVPPRPTAPLSDLMFFGVVLNVNSSDECW
jgi:hypothetical protein